LSTFAIWPLEEFDMERLAEEAVGGDVGSGGSCVI